MSHILEYANLKEFSWEHELAGSYGKTSHKSLKAYSVFDEEKVLTYFNVYDHRELILRTTSIKEAIETYNELR